MFLLFILFPALFEPELMVGFSNIQEAKGSLYVAVYDRSDAFLKVDQVYSKKIVPIGQTGLLKVSLGKLPPGDYALSCFHDLNGNGQLDTNWAGIPTEPYGFSNNARPKFRAPKWAEAAFEMNGSGGLISVRLEEW
ncbi:MAG: DUF2141 domain-containing protein [Saprospiraceae bacterium]|nr:DUF2141 domain-containing protein [Saprospiraceae bacterium]